MFETIKKCVAYECVKKNGEETTTATSTPKKNF